MAVRDLSKITVNNAPPNPCASIQALLMQESVDFDFPGPGSSDIDWVSLPTYCSNDSPSLQSPVQGCSSPAVHSRGSDDAGPIAYMHLTWEAESSSTGSDSSRSPREYGFPLLSCPPSWLQSRPELEEDATEIHQVPLSSSPPEFTSSSPTSDISSELGKEEGSSSESSRTSASSGTRSDTASLSASQHVDCGQRQDYFSQRLHELLLLVLRSRELERSRTLDETDCTTCTSLSDDSSSSGMDFENFEKDDQDVIAKTGTSTPSCTVIRSPDPTVMSKWFLDQGFVSQTSNQLRYAYFCAYMH